MSVDCPDLRDAIKSLKTETARFATLSKEYNQDNKEHVVVVKKQMSELSDRVSKVGQIWDAQISGTRGPKFENKPEGAIFQCTKRKTLTFGGFTFRVGDKITRKTLVVGGGIEDLEILGFKKNNEVIFKSFLSDQIWMIEPGELIIGIKNLK